MSAILTPETGTRISSMERVYQVQSQDFVMIVRMGATTGKRNKIIEVLDFKNALGIGNWSGLTGDPMSNPLLAALIDQIYDAIEANPGGGSGPTYGLNPAEFQINGSNQLAIVEIDASKVKNLPPVYTFTGTANQYTRGNGTYGQLAAVAVTGNFNDLINIPSNILKYKGLFATPAALTAAHPTADPGDYATVDSTDTVWIWDTDTSAWKDSFTNTAAVDLTPYAQSATAENTIDITPADSNNTTGIFKGLLSGGKLKLKSAVERLTSLFGGHPDALTTTAKAIIPAINELAARPVGVRTVNAPNHGFSVGWALTPTLTRARAVNSGTESQVWGVVTEVIDANNYRYVTAGGIVNITGLGLSANKVYWLRETQTGPNYTDVRPSLAGQVEQAVFVTNANATEALVLGWAGFEIVEEATYADISPADLLAYWNFEQPGGTTYLDQSGNSRTLTRVGGVTDITGKRGNAAGITPAAQAYLTASGTGLSAGATGLTVVAWFRQTASGFFMVVQKRTGIALEYGIYGSSTAIFAEANDPQGNYFAVSVPFTASNAWQFVVLRWNGTQLSIQLNDGAPASTSLSTIRTGTNPFRIGANMTPADFLTGGVDEVRIYGRALSTTEITTLYTNSSGGGGGANLTDGDKGDIIVSSNGTVWTIDTVPASKVSGLSTVATTNNYNDLSNKPTIPADVPDATTSVKGKVQLAVTGDADSEATKAATLAVVMNRINAAVTALRGGNNADTLSSIRTDLTTILAIVGPEAGDGDTVVNTVREMLTVFQNYTEGVSLATQLNNLNTAIGTLSGLTTTAKASLVAAINEVNAKPTGGGTVIATDAEYAAGNTTKAAAPDQVNRLVEANSDYTPADSNNTTGFFKTLLTSGKLKLKPALDRIVTTIGGNADTLATTSKTLIGAVNEVKASNDTKYGLSNEILFFGDSITFGVGASITANRWTSKAAALLGLAEVNKGISGTVLQNTISEFNGNFPLPNNGRDRLRNDIINVFKFPGRVYILYGLNDLRHASVNFTVGHFEQDYEEVIQELLASGIQPRQIALGSPPYMNPSFYTAANAAPYNAGSTAKHVEYVAAVKRVAAKYGVRYADVYTAMLNGGANTLLDPDGIHPNDAGMQLIATTMIDAEFVRPTLTEGHEGDGQLGARAMMSGFKVNNSVYAGYFGTNMFREAGVLKRKNPALTGGFFGFNAADSNLGASAYVNLYDLAGNARLMMQGGLTADGVTPVFNIPSRSSVGTNDPNKSASPIVTTVGVFSVSGNSDKTNIPSQNLQYFKLNDNRDFGLMGWNTYWSGSAWRKQNPAQGGVVMFGTPADTNADNHLTFAFTPAGGTQAAPLVSALEMRLTAAGTGIWVILNNLPVHADNTEAVNAGLPAGTLYRTTAGAISARV